MTKTFLNNFIDKRTKIDYTFFPIGSVIQYGGGNAPDGFLLCDGSNVSRKTYADLFSVIETRFGSGNGSTTFTLPNLVSKFPRGCGTANDVGGESGADTVTLKTTNLPNHSHGLGNHTHTFSGTSGNESAHETFKFTTGNQSNGHTHTFTTGAMSGEQKANFSINNHCKIDYDLYNSDFKRIEIKDNTTGHNYSDHCADRDNEPSMIYVDLSHTHSGTTNGISDNHTHSGNGTCSGDHTHDYSGTTSQASGNTDSTGSDTAFSIVPSYVNFYYIIKY